METILIKHDLSVYAYFIQCTRIE